MSARSVSAIVGITAIAGTLGGLFVAVTWRYATPRRFLETHLAVTRPGDQAFALESVDHTNYVSGPEWLPIAVELPLIGLVVGLAVGLLLRILLNLSGSRRFAVVASTAGALVTGITTGLIGAALFGNRPAKLFVETVTTAHSDGSSPYMDLNHLPGAPRHVDLNVTPYLTFSAAGAIAAIAVLVVTAVTYQVVRGAALARTQNRTRHLDS